MTTLNQRTALITGAAGGMGSAIAAALSQAGASVVLHYRTSGATAEALATKIRAAGGTAHLAQGDLSERDGPERVYQHAVHTAGAIDILVNCAGGYLEKALLSTTLAEWDALMASDARACFALSRAAAPAMMERGWGRIVNLSSVAGERYVEGEGAYGSAKAAINLLTRALAVELAPHGVTVNAVAPAWTLPADAPFPVAPSNDRCQDVPNRRPGHAREVAALIAYLASDAAAHITGQIIAIDGGLSARSPSPR